MARITTNTSGTQPVIQISTYANLANSITIPFLQDITITNSTGVYSYTTFSDVDMRKLSTPADNEISTNVVLDDTTWFGNSAFTPSTAAPYYGLSDISINKRAVYFKIYYSGVTTGTNVTTGTGFITNLAPTTSPEAPLWVSPLSIAVDGGLENSKA